MLFAKFTNDERKRQWNIILNSVLIFLFTIIEVKILANNTILFSLVWSSNSCSCCWRCVWSYTKQKLCFLKVLFNHFEPVQQKDLLCEYFILHFKNVSHHYPLNPSWHQTLQQTWTPTIVLHPPLCRWIYLYNNLLIPIFFLTLWLSQYFDTSESLQFSCIS